MAKFYRHKNGIGWIKITWLELADYSDNMMPICDQCLTDLIGFSNIVLIPLLNQAYCPDCGKKVVSEMFNFEEDRLIAKRREEFYSNYFGIKEDRPAVTETASNKNTYPQFTNRDSSCQDTKEGSKCQKN